MEYQLSVAKSVNTIKPHFQGHQESNLASDLVMTVKKRGRVDSLCSCHYATLSQMSTTKLHETTFVISLYTHILAQTYLIQRFAKKHSKKQNKYEIDINVITATTTITTISSFVSIGNTNT